MNRIIMTGLDVLMIQNFTITEKGIYKTKRGKHGGTYAHWKIALAYAQYLSHELHMRVTRIGETRIDHPDLPKLK